MNKKSCILFLSCVVISIILTIIFSPFDKKVISYDTIINIEIALFSVSLTIVALLITILEKYKDRMSVRTGKEFYFLISLKGRKAKEFYKALDLVLEILHEFEALLPESSQKIPCSKEQ